MSRKEAIHAYCFWCAGVDPQRDADAIAVTDRCPNMRRCVLWKFRPQLRPQDGNSVTGVQKLSEAAALDA